MTPDDLQRELLSISERFRQLANVARHHGRDELADEIHGIGMLTASAIAHVTNHREGRVS